MKKEQIQCHEQKRLETLHALNILDTEAEMCFDLIVNLASKTCNTPMAAITLVDSDRQWFKASHGIEEKQTSREVAFCSYTILENKPFLVENTLTDKRFCNNPLVMSPPNIRSYLGIPLTVCGYVVGALCVLDDKARGFSALQIQMLTKLAEKVLMFLQARGRGFSTFSQPLQSPKH